MVVLVQSLLLLKYWLLWGLGSHLGFSPQTSVHFLTGASVLAVACMLIPGLPSPCASVSHLESKLAPEQFCLPPGHLSWA